MSDRISRNGGTPLAVADGKRLLGVIHLKDIVKGGMKERFAQLDPQARGEARVGLAGADVRLVVISGAGDRGFCAGGDLKELTRAVETGEVHLADQFFREEYALDLLVHQFPKPVVVLADGFTMGGGLGLAAGADLCMGSRFKGAILPGAMPWKNRYIGNPALTATLNLLFHASTSAWIRDPSRAAICSRSVSKSDPESVSVTGSVTLRICCGCRPRRSPARRSGRRTRTSSTAPPRPATAGPAPEHSPDRTPDRRASS